MNSVTTVLDRIANEAARGVSLYGRFASAHEGYAVLLEEFRELEAHVFQKPANRDLNAMRVEAMQIAAMALRFITEICDNGLGRQR